MGANVLERLALLPADLQSIVGVPTSPRIELAPFKQTKMFLFTGQELVLDPNRAGPAGWSVFADASGTKVFTNDLSTWTFTVIPPD